MPLDNLPADSKADPCTFVLAASVKPLERRKDPVEIFFVKPDTVVFNPDLAQAVRTPVLFPLGVKMSANLYYRRNAAAVKLESVADQILQKLPHLERVGLDGRKFGYIDTPARLLKPYFQIVDDIVRYVAEIGLDERLGLCGNPRKRQQVVDQGMHTPGGVLHTGEVILGLLV